MALLSSAFSSRRAPLWVLFGSVLISFAPIYVRGLALAPDLLAFYRMLFCSLTLAAVFAAKRIPIPVTRKALLLLFLSGVFLAVDFMFWHRSIFIIGPGLATLLANSQVFFTAVISFLLFRIRMTRPFFIGMVGALLGLYLITGTGGSATVHPEASWGIFLGFLTGLFYSCYLITLKKSIMDNPALSGMIAMFVVSSFAALFLGVVILSSGDSFALPSVSAGVSLFLFGSLHTAFAWSIITAGMRYIPAAVAGLLLLLQPTLSFVWDVLIFHRPTSLVDAFGVVLVLLAIYIGSLRK